MKIKVYRVEQGEISLPLRSNPYRTIETRVGDLLISLNNKDVYYQDYMDKEEENNYVLLNNNISFFDYNPKLFTKISSNGN